MHCSQCGAEVPADARYCPKCGRSIGAAAAATADPGETPATAPPSDASMLERFAAQAGRPPDDEVETDLWEGGYSPRAMIGHWLVLAGMTVALLVGALFLVEDRTIWGGLVALILVIWLGDYLLLLYRQWSVHYALSSQRFIHQEGILRRVTDRVELIDIDDITFEQGVLDRLTGVGTIRIVSSDRTHPELALRGIANVQEVARLIDDTRRAERRKRGLHIEAI